MFNLVEIICTYYVIGILVSTARSLPPDQLGYNSFMWGPVLAKSLWLTFMTYLAKFQIELQNLQSKEEEED